MMKRLLLILVGIAFLFQTGLHADSPMYLVVYDLDKMEWKVRYTNEEPDLNKDVCRTTRSMIHNLIADIRKTLHEYNIEYIFSCERNCYRIIPEMVLCDYYEFLDDKTKTNFIGEFMSEYEWAIYVSPELSDIEKSRLNK